MKFRFAHESIEINAGLLIGLTLLVISIGGLVEIVPLFYIDETIEEVEGVRPYTPLEQAGRDIYVREGCYTCHSQMIRPFRDELLRYGHYSLATESQYDHPFQWGSKRTGPDLARVGEKYSNEWHVQHLEAPRSVVPESIMPNYPWLSETALNTSDIEGKLRALKMVGVPYSDTDEEYQANVERFGEEAAKMLDIHSAEKNLIAQAQAGNYDGDRSNLTEMDAMVAYLQLLGTLVDFSKYDEGYFAEFR
ncbi:cytochrome-c oxidase, cbb3-type subunit II [Solemya velum gill symbiont]|uniref:cytochrome-c oxidase, cbb3-type subunit II n=1 Tax=Solemya velum gill symbiont TaxID=2340 RepID=UPI00099745B9|nr:cytochrome-c oxidase, cbb3-type subunit II [Solemya velum gill symbiont]OOZ23393.1 cytochrome-c oxidase, cbb3-type subunit II [Solemya velum gill symbiont]OOZ25479.1 cytochrome-c oxidase, cbb3-type subunit II [Solemya velum gill symbiont]OOZ29132.1 cytochrome-c oxidase, cbb3-type subunit II [Solemya velum gill symbiont]OOZ32866.1 cytochrome-c oxidase, cbb3-type subunit II [Solemya velum gill symbiont]OOZ35091.1 cytochrome-c oxidase, cbb3-type subunit II [Solemya velum gill symbiont]